MVLDRDDHHAHIGMMVRCPCSFDHLLYVGMYNVIMIHYWNIKANSFLFAVHIQNLGLKA